MHEDIIPLEHNKNKPLGTAESIQKTETGPGINPAVVGAVEKAPASEQSRLMYEYLRKPSEDGFNKLLATAADDYMQNPRHEDMPMATDQETGEVIINPDTGKFLFDLKKLGDIVRPFTYPAIKDLKPDQAALAYAEFLDQFTNAIRFDAQRKADAQKKEQSN